MSGCENSDKESRNSRRPDRERRSRNRDKDSLSTSEAVAIFSETLKNALETRRKRIIEELVSVASKKDHVPSSSFRSEDRINALGNIDLNCKVGNTSEASKLISSEIDNLNQRNKLLRIADKYGLDIAREYSDDPITENGEDAAKLRNAINSSGVKRNSNRFQPYFKGNKKSTGLGYFDSFSSNQLFRGYQAPKVFQSQFQPYFDRQQDTSQETASIQDNFRQERHQRSQVQQQLTDQSTLAVNSEVEYNFEHSGIILLKAEIKDKSYEINPNVFPETKNSADRNKYKKLNDYYSNEKYCLKKRERRKERTNNYNKGHWQTIQQFKDHETFRTIVSLLPSIVKMRKSDATNKKYGITSKHFKTAVSTLALFLGSLIQQRVSVPVLESYFYCVSGRRILSKPVDKKEPVTVEILEKLIDKFGDESNLFNLRICVICLLGFSGFLRYDELSNIKMKDISFEQGYIELFIRKSKTDVYRRGKKIVIAETGNRLRP
ncbi:hypothetical protein KUTeg_011423, partial [Tegillarca granosa]